ncbi:methylated-DNA--[protein]-cysteine S-methyltransferase [Paraglaciecola aquimarina]|uniref:Methylated-DNA--protein-cysteine methyltransferase n=1 Tax=Paraglaciecola algarum TaxID=3050085 RepID=A0ABS9D3M4_9ALTE|nr:methylated-DNA--[protein]-cysteine S-methyltransferase [Paraglaciecola sp. G1-23]MCF2947523.1 methylated-DNA--[protein]-cysteine S-methyltransferase [Paraglaciecola sp. G1-23]
MNKTTQFIQHLNSTFGKIEIQANVNGVTSLRFEQTTDAPDFTNQHTESAAEQLTEYFAGQRSNFDIPIVLNGTEFQKKVWEQLLKIPLGETFSYADIARKINNPKAVRAVGSANGRNPIAIIVPCHRVIGSDGSLTGYAWGTTRKQRLLTLEKTIRTNTSAI